MELLNIEILTKTFDDLPVGVGIFRVDDIDDVKSIRYVFMNKVVLFEMRKTEEEVFGKTILEVAPEAFEHEGGRYVLETYRKVAAEGGSVNLGLVEYSNHMVAGTYECSVHHIQDNYVYVMLRNVTELEQTKTELELRNEELSQFAYIASHDLSEPINTITGLVQLINKRYRGKLDERADTTLKYMVDALHRMRNLINSLLAYSRSRTEEEMASVDCNELIEVIRQDLDAKIKESNASIEVGELPKIQGYETELRLLFQNLITNAIKFKKAGTNPTINIGMEEQDGWVFSVQDEGIGIAEEHKEGVFEMFNRVHSKSEYEGAGIGLAHCRKIVDMHGGRIWVDSTLGEGSTFRFKLPY